MTLIMQSLLTRWNYFCPDICIIEDDGIAEILAFYTRPTRYALHTAEFSVDGYNLRGFRGDLALQFLGSDMVRRVLGILLTFAPFSGIGIKTVLGMGAVETTIRESRINSAPSS